MKKTYDPEVDQLIERLMDAANFVSSDDFDVVIKASLAKKAAEKLFQLHNEVDMHESAEYNRQMME